MRYNMDTGVPVGQRWEKTSAPTVVHDVTRGNQLKLPQGHILPAGLNLHPNLSVQLLHRSRDETQKTNIAAEFFGLSPEILTRDLEDTRQDIQR